MRMVCQLIEETQRISLFLQRSNDRLIDWLTSRPLDGQSMCFATYFSKCVNVMQMITGIPLHEVPKLGRGTVNEKFFPVE